MHYPEQELVYAIAKNLTHRIKMETEFSVSIKVLMQIMTVKVSVYTWYTAT
jgi:hypothetical protein